MRRQGHYGGYRSATHQIPDEFGSLSFNTQVPDYFGIPVDDIRNVTEQLYTRGEQNRLASEELKLAAELDIQNVRPMDSQIIIDAMNKIDNDFSEFIDGKNFHSANRVLSKSYREYVSNPKRQAAIKERAKEIAYDELMNERIGPDGDLPSREYAAKAKQMSINEPISIDEQGNITGGFQPYVPAQFVSELDLVNEYLKKNGWKSDSFLTERWDTSTLGHSPYMQGQEWGRSGVSYEEVAIGITNLLNNHDGYQAWLRSKYEMDNFDPSTGDMKPINENRLALSMPIKKIDSNGKPRPVSEVLQEGREALDGMVLMMQHNTRLLEDKDLSYEDALRAIDKQAFVQNHIDGAINSVGLSISGVHTIDKQKLMKDALYFHRQSQLNDGRVELANLGQTPANYSIREANAAINRTTRDLNDNKVRLERFLINNNIDDASNISDPDLQREYDDLKYTIRDLETQINRMSYTRNNIIAAIPDTDFNSAFNKAFPNITRYITRQGVEELKTALRDTNNPEYARNIQRVVLNNMAHGYLGKDHDVEEILNTVRNDEGIPLAVPMGHFGVGLIKNRSAFKRGLDRFHNAIDKKAQINLANTHVAFTPYEGTRSHEILEYSRYLLENNLFNGVTLDGISTSDKRLADPIRTADNRHLSLLTSTNDGNLTYLLTLTHGDKVSYYEMTGPDLRGTTATVIGDDLLRSLNTNTLMSAPEINYRKDLYFSNNGRNLPTVQVSDGVARRSNETFGDLIESYNLEHYKSGQTTLPRDIIIPIEGHNDTRELELQILRTQSGYRVKYNDGVNPNLVSLPESIHGVDKIYRDLFQLYRDVAIKYDQERNKLNHE